MDILQCGISVPEGKEVGKLFCHICSSLLTAYSYFIFSKVLNTKWYYDTYGSQ